MASSKPTILAISFHDRQLFQDIHASLVAHLTAAADLVFAESASSAGQRLSRIPPPSAVLLTDAALTLPENAAIWENVVAYARKGGRVIVFGLFPGFLQPDQAAPFFSRAGLPWDYGSYMRTTLVINRSAVGHERTATKLPTSYSQKAVFVKNVLDTEMWYKTDDGSVVESRVFAPTKADVRGETPVALGKVGEGSLAYVGDVNGEEGSNSLILAMCGLL